MSVSVAVPSSKSLLADDDAVGKGAGSPIPDSAVAAALNQLKTLEDFALVPEHSFPKNKIKVLLLEKIHPDAVEMFKKEGFLVDTVAGALNEEELISRIGDVHILGVRSKTMITKRVLAASKKLLCQGCFCIGTDQTDLDAAALNGTVVFNAPFANTRSVAELVLAELIFLARQAGDRSMECHQGKWNKVSTRCYEVRGKTLGIIGYGHVGSQLSVLAESLGMSVLFYDILPKLPLGNAKAAASMDAVLANADFVSLHVPATQETERLIAAAQIAKMKKGSYLINASRGNVVDVEDTATALRSSQLGGAAFDVYPDEPADNTDKFKTPLQGCKNVILTPHVGGSTEEAQAAIGREVAAKLIAYVNTGSTQGSVNMPEQQMKMHKGTHRILNIHHNVPGVLKEINAALSDYNVVAQVLMTAGPVGYLMADVDKAVAAEIKKKIAALQPSIKTRVLY